MLTYAGRGRWSSAPSGSRGGRGGYGGASTRAGARSAGAPSQDGATGDIATISRLQATAGNRAVTELLTAQREDEQKPAAATDPTAAPKPDAKADPTADKAALRKAWTDAGPVGGEKVFELINSDLSIESLVGMALPELVGLANEGAAAGFAKGTEDTKGEIKEVGLDKKEAGQVTRP